MKYQILLLVMWTFSLVSPAHTKGKTKLQKANDKNNNVKTQSLYSIFVPMKNEVEMCLCYNFFAPSETSKIKFVVLVPKTIPYKQKILEVECFPKPSRRFSSKDGNQYVEFIITEPKIRFVVEINVKAELYRYDLSIAKEKQMKKPLAGWGFDDFLQDEKMIEKNHPEIQRIARKIKGRTDIETVENIYNYVINNMEYIIHKEKGGAVYAAQRKKGDCSEYSDLFVALCRAANIPARVVIGYAVILDDTVPRHAWAEVYLPKYGWVPFEPTWGDVEESRLQKELFSIMRPVYIYLKDSVSDEVLSQRQFTMVRSWGDRVEMEHSVNFKRWNVRKKVTKKNIVRTERKATHGVVGGVVYTQDKPLAIIDGKIFKEGDVIHGLKIVTIYENKVEFERSGKRWTQKVGETAEIFWK